LTLSKRDKASKKVKFAGFLEIRTHSLVLGDHPCCVGGMALEFGWRHLPDSEIVDLQVFEEVSLKRRNGQLRLDYGERRELLQEATGFTGSQLLQQEYELVCGCAPMLLHHTPSISQSLASTCDIQ
jgi:hypothetical protein